MKRSEQVLAAMNGIGDDLVVMAEQQTFPRGAWQRIVPVAACLVLILGTAAALRQLLPLPVQSEPLAQEEELPAEESVPKVPSKAPEEPVPTEQAQEPVLRQLKSLDFYVFDPDPETDTGPSKAIAADGTVLLEVESGRIEPLIDQASGEYVAITVCRRAGGATANASYYDIYTLGGKPVVNGMAAYGIECLGNMVLVLESDGVNYRASVFQRDTYALLRNNFRTGMVVGDCIWLTPQDGDGSVQYLIDDTGALTTAEVPVDSYFIWQNRAYFVVRLENGTMGLMDSKGRELIRDNRMKACYGISNGYARCEDETGHYLVDVSTGREVFRWDWPILGAFDQQVMVHMEDLQYALTDWAGNVLCTGSMIHTLDDEEDGVPERFLVSREDGQFYFDPNGDVRAIHAADTQIGDHVSSRTALLMEDNMGVRFLLDVTDGTRTELDRVYDTTSPILEENQATGLFYAMWFETEGEIGRRWCDIVREDGTVVLSGLSAMWTRQGDVFYTDDGQVRGLIRLDGTWLYQEPAQ